MSQKPISFGSQLVGLDNFTNGVVDLKPTGNNKIMNMWGWTSHHHGFQKGHVCEKIKNESFGSSPRANHERFIWLGPFDMKYTMSSSYLGPHIILFWAPS